MAAPIFGICLDLTAMASTVLGPGTWNATAGTFSATLPSKGSCGGAGGVDACVLHLVANACGKLHFNVSGVGYAYNALAASALVYTPFFTVVSLSSPGGGSAFNYCATGAMTGTPTGDLVVNCGSDIYLQLGRSPSPNGTDQGALSATFTVSIVP